MRRTAFAEGSVTGTRGRHTWVLGGAVQVDDYRPAQITRFDYRFTAPAVFAQDEVVLQEHLAAQLPMLLKGMYFDGWRPSATPVKIRDRQEFLDGIRETLRTRMPTADADRITRAVFELLTKHVSEGEIDQVIGSLPEELRELWPAAARGAS